MYYINITSLCNTFQKPNSITFLKRENKKVGLQKEQQTERG